MKIKQLLVPIGLIVLVIGVVIANSLPTEDGERKTTAIDYISDENLIDNATFIPYREGINFSNEKNVIFFSATWCASCYTVKKDFIENTALIPRNVTIYEADVDTFKDLEKKYGVTIQHTFVQVDKDGKELKQWMGSTNIEEFLQEVI